MLQSLFGERKFIQAIAKDTLLICAFHLIIFAVLKGVMLYVFKIEPSILTGTVFLNVIFALISMLICVLICKILEKLNLKRFIIPN
jgi:fucose 4-O-acetylase-like acetyltransferase